MKYCPDCGERTAKYTVTVFVGTPDEYHYHTDSRYGWPGA